MKKDFIRINDTIHTLRHNQAHASEDRKQEIQQEIDAMLYSPQEPSIFELSQHIKSLANKGFSCFEEAGFQQGKGFEGKTMTEAESISLCVARECLRAIYHTINDERFTELSRNENY